MGFAEVFFPSATKPTEQTSKSKAEQPKEPVNWKSLITTSADLMPANIREELTNAINYGRSVLSQEFTENVVIKNKDESKPKEDKKTLRSRLKSHVENKQNRKSPNRNFFYSLLSSK